MKHIIHICLAITLLLLAACDQDRGFYRKYEDLIDSSKPLAYGANNVVHMFAAIPALESVTALDMSITRETTLVVPEQYFQVAKDDPSRLQDLRKSRNLVLCGTLDSPDPVSAFIRQTLAPQLIEEVKSNGSALLVDTNVFCRDQIILFLLATDTDKLAALMQERADQAFYYLLEQYQKRLAYQAYRTKVMEAKVFQNSPFMLQLPLSYTSYKNDSKGAFLSFIYQPRIPDRKVADKYVSVYYEAMQENDIDSTWIYQKRQELGAKYFDGDQIAPEGNTAEPVMIAGYKGWKLSGSWVNSSLNSGVGGAFQTFAFWHAPSKTAYLIDNLVYFPDGEKLPVLLELGMISQSLVIK